MVTTNIVAFEIHNTLHIGGFASVSESGWYDGWGRTILFHTTDGFEFKTKVIGGFSDNSAYAVASFYAEAGVTECMFGLKTTLHAGEETGGFGKFGYPPLKELPELFFLDDFAYRDRFTVTKNSEGVKEFVSISTAYFNADVHNVRFRGRTMFAEPENIYPNDAIHDLQWFRDFTLELSYGSELLSGGVMFLKGPVLDYCFKNIDRDLDGDGTTLNDKYKDTLVFGLLYGKVQLNTAFYDYMNRYYYSAVRITVPMGGHEYSVYAEVNDLNKVTSVFLTQDYRRDLYGSMNYKNDDNDLFLAAADTEVFGRLSLIGMICYRDVYSEDLYYEGVVGSLTAAYATEIGIFSCTIGTTHFTTVWDAWQIFPEDPSLIAALSWEYDF